MPDVYLEGRKTQQHRLEKLVKDYLGENERLPDSYFKTELELVQHKIISQFIDAIREEAKGLEGFSSIYLKG